MDFGIFGAVVILFYFLGRIADIIVVNIRKLSINLGVGVFFLGLIFGFFTSLPELAIGISALGSNIPGITLGNLMGGIVVLFGLILGFSLVLNRSIITDGKFSSILPLLAFLFLPLVFGLNGRIGPYEGLFLVVLCLLLVYLVYKKTPTDKETLEKTKTQVLAKVFTLLWAAVLLLLVSNFIIRLSLFLLKDLRIGPFAMGLILFSAGTNLPEIIVTVRSWRRHLKELSISNLVGSAMANVLLIGIFAFLRPFNVSLGLSYYSLLIVAAMLFAVLAAAYRTGRALTRREGIVLIIIYFLFLLSQIGLVTSAA